MVHHCQSSSVHRCDGHGRDCRVSYYVNFVFCLCGVVTENAENRIFGQSSRTILSDARKTVSQSTPQHSEDKAHNNNDDDDDGVYALRAAVNEERVKVCGLV